MTFLTNGKQVSFEEWVSTSSKQFQINKQWLRITQAITKAFQGADKGLITEEQLQQKLSCVSMARKALQAAQHRLNNRGY